MFKFQVLIIIALLYEHKFEMQSDSWYEMK